MINNAKYYIFPWIEKCEVYKWKKILEVVRGENRIEIKLQYTILYVLA
jgi:hypothetical protein